MNEIKILTFINYFVFMYFELDLYPLKENL
jgi:hypothetical protein